MIRIAVVALAVALGPTAAATDQINEWAAQLRPSIEAYRACAISYLEDDAKIRLSKSFEAAEQIVHLVCQKQISNFITIYDRVTADRGGGFEVITRFHRGVREQLRTSYESAYAKYETADERRIAEIKEWCSRAFTMLGNQYIDPFQKAAMLDAMRNRGCTSGQFR